jgi:Fe-S oxidoreductase
MKHIFEVSGESVWWADRDGGVCCGRPLELAGEISAARNIIDFNKDLFRKYNISTLVTSCPICLKVFREDYSLKEIEVLHHTEYILRLIKKGMIAITDSGEKMAYHDPCELGRGCGIYSEPRDIISRAGRLVECKSHGRDTLCCGSSLANTGISNIGQNAISR